MAKGPFGNPLSTGIALSGVIDMTPYRQMHARKMAKLEDEKKEKKRKKKELAGILSKVTLDEDKIFWRQHDNAKIKYADTIDKITTMYNNEDYSGMYKAMNDFSMDMGNLMQENAAIKARDVQIAKGNVYYDPAVEAMKNNRDVSNEDYGLALEETGYGDISENGIYNYIALQELVDENKLVNDFYKNIDRQVMFDKSGKPLNVMGRSDNTRYLRNEIPEQIYNQGIATVGSDISKNKLQELAYFRSKKFPINDLAGMSPADQMAKKQEWYKQALEPIASKFRYGQTEDPIQATPSTKSDYTRPGVIGKVQIAEAEPSPISREAFNFDSYKEGATPFIETEVAKIINENTGNDAAIATAIQKITGPSGDVKDANDYFGPNIISVGGNKINIDNPEEAAKEIARILSEKQESDFKAIASNFGYSEPTPTEVLKDFEKTATVNVFGRDIRKTFKIPKGEVYIIGSKGAKKVKILNAVDVPNSTFRSVNRDKENGIWHGIDFPVEEESVIKQSLNEALGKAVLDDFVKSHGLPKGFVVPEIDENIQTLQTLDKALTPEFLDAELRRIGVYGAGTTTNSSQDKYKKYGGTVRKQ